jgi:hypothetical protein
MPFLKRGMPMRGKAAIGHALAHAQSIELTTKWVEKWPF